MINNGSDVKLLSENTIHTIVSKHKKLCKNNNVYCRKTTQLVGLLCRNGFSVNYQNDSEYFHDGRTCTPLHYIMTDYTKNDEIMLNKLLSLGADVNARNNERLTPVHLAITISGDVVPTKILIDKISDPKLQLYYGFFLGNSQSSY